MLVWWLCCIGVALASKEKSSGSKEKSSSEEIIPPLLVVPVKITQPELRKIPMHLDITVNGKHWEIEGMSEFKPGTGESMISLEFDRDEFPTGFQPELLTYILFGKLWPSKPFGADMISMFDKFASVPEKLDYNITRSLFLMDKLGKLESYYYCDHAKEEVLRYVIWGTVNVPMKFTHEMWPLVEIWEPSDKLCFWEGGMHWMWKMQSDVEAEKWLWGYSETDYSFNCTKKVDDLKIKEKIMRVFTFDIEPTDKGFVLHETIKMYEYNEYIKTFIW